MEWTRILAYITGTVDQELLRNEYLAASTKPPAYRRQSRLSAQHCVTCRRILRTSTQLSWFFIR